MTIATNVNVTVDPLPQVEGLIKYVREMNVSPGLQQTLLTPLLAAQQAYQSDQPVLGKIQVETFKIAVQIHRNAIPDGAEKAIREEIRDLQSCI